ncbi:hypothetical protein FA13DRAFT_694219 [Coprinellus micaceus]|uniref:Secreted protein n=1 Tax=Coprinellus micaceus TaxID=71717 RepID=A0A4Y7S9E9_COPMI|nr:hypothetical protein FA13DRAFT_694219 [Coprinellus micaceus]
MVTLFVLTWFSHPLHVLGPSSLPSDCSTLPKRLMFHRIRDDNRVNLVHGVMEYLGSVKCTILTSSFRWVRKTRGEHLDHPRLQSTRRK